MIDCNEADPESASYAVVEYFLRLSLLLSSTRPEFAHSDRLQSEGAVMGNTWANPSSSLLIHFTTPSKFFCNSATTVQYHSDTIQGISLSRFTSSVRRCPGKQANSKPAMYTKSVYDLMARAHQAQSQTLLLQYVPRLKFPTVKSP